jgi:hypothetical protein
MVKRGLSSKEETQTSKKKDLLKVCARCAQGVRKVCARISMTKTMCQKRPIVEAKETSF